jgi:phytoene synthase
MKGATDDTYCLHALKQADPERYFTCVFAPEKYRAALAALYAFNLDIVRTRELVSDPMIGEIRLQWWRDALHGVGEGDASAHPIAGPLLKAIAEYHLPIEALINLIDARVFDLYDDSMPSLHDLEAYCGETSSALFQLSLLILSDGRSHSSADLCGHAGVAFGVTALLKAFPWHAARGQLYLPQDVLRKHGLSSEDIFKRQLSPSIDGVLREMRAHVRDHLSRARAEIKRLPDDLFQAFLALTSIEPALRAMDKRHYDPFTSVIEPSRLGLIFRYWQTARLKRL